jgi:uroporphyrin-III C-methyltransferase
VPTRTDGAREGLVLLAHGSPTAEGLDAVTQLCARVAVALPDVAVVPGFLGHAAPDVPAAVQQLTQQGCTRVVVVPLLLTPGAHTTRDVPAEVARVTTDVVLSVAPSIGGHPRLVDAVVDRAGPGSAQRVLVLVAGGGRPEADAEAARVAHLAARLAGYAWGTAAFTGSSPDLQTVLGSGPPATVVPYLLGPGVMLDRATAVHPVTEPIGTHPGVVDAIVARWREAPTGVRPGPWVALVGGGPGDPGLLTRRAVELLAVADVVVTDRLAPTLHGLAHGEVLAVGKGPGHGTSQEEINQLLVARASAGQRVVRLKGGDPFVFGRGGEEWLACVAAGIAVEVVPGVSSAVGAPAAAGVPVTHRGVSAAFTVLSAHVPPGDPQDPHDWDALAHVHGTLVVLMGVATMRAVTAELVARGKDPGTPAALVHRAGMPGQQVARGTLGDIADSALSNPAVLVIGDVVGVLGAGGAH